MSKSVWISGAIVLACSSLVAGQDATPENRVTVPFRDAAQPRKLVVKVMIGGVTIRGYDGKDAIIESAAIAETARRNRNNPVPQGMHRLDQNQGLDISEDNNTITVKNDGLLRGSKLTIQVPVQTSVSVESMTSGEISVDNITGEIDVTNMNGGVNVTNASGSVMAHSMNGKITVALNKLADKPMSFSTMNGSIDVTLPAETKANLKLKTDNGDIYTDFDVKVDARGNQPQIQDDRNKGGKYRIRVDRAVLGSINGGGPELQFTTFNGRILLHKK